MNGQYTRVNKQTDHYNMNIKVLTLPPLNLTFV